MSALPVYAEEIGCIWDEEEVFKADTSILFKETQVHRLYDQKRNIPWYIWPSAEQVGAQASRDRSRLRTM